MPFTATTQGAAWWRRLYPALSTSGGGRKRRAILQGALLLRRLPHCLSNFEMVSEQVVVVVVATTCSVLESLLAYRNARVLLNAWLLPSSS